MSTFCNVLIAIYCGLSSELSAYITDAKKTPFLLLYEQKAFSAEQFLWPNGKSFLQRKYRVVLSAHLILHNIAEQQKRNSVARLKEDASYT